MHCLHICVRIQLNVKNDQHSGEVKTPLERIKELREKGIVLFPNLSIEAKRCLLYIEDEPIISAGQSQEFDN